jgi:hypothetical protein
VGSSQPRCSSTSSSFTGTRVSWSCMHSGTSQHTTSGSSRSAARYY